MLGEKNGKKKKYCYQLLVISKNCCTFAGVDI
jgi:hypothetical protein